MRELGEPEPDIRGARRKMIASQFLFVAIFLAGAILNSLMASIYPILVAVALDLALIHWVSRQPWAAILKS